MHEAIVVGAGLTGLVCAYELEKRGVACTLIEVKPNVGGSIQTLERDGFTLDSYAYALLDSLTPVFLRELGLNNALYALPDSSVAFKRGTAQLVQAIAERVRAPRMMRMAVSSVGEITADDGTPYATLCLENGIMLTARAVVLAIPARYATHALRSYRPALSDALAGYHYDTLQRAWFAYPLETLRSLPKFKRDDTYVHHYRLEETPRTPQGQGLLHVLARINPQSTTPEGISDYLLHALGLSAPMWSSVAYWAEADPLSCYDDQQAQRLALIARELPAHMALIGSDYCTRPTPRGGVFRFDERVEQAQATAQRLATYLKG